MTEKIKPCPFCGSTQVDIFASFGDAEPNQNYMNVECLSCGAQGATKLGEALAIAAWNNRAAGQLIADTEIFRLATEYANSSKCLHCQERKTALKNALTPYNRK